MKRALMLLIMFLWPAQIPAQTPIEKPQTQKREGSISGRILGQDGQPLAGVGVQADRIGGKHFREISAASDEEGNFKLTGLATGVYRLDARIPGFIVESGFSQRDVYRIGDYATLQMVKGGVITGRVTDDVGDPIVGAEIRAH